MRIAIFSDTVLPQINGVSLTLKRWTEYLQEHGIACKVFAPLDPAENTAPPTELFSIPLLPYPEYRLSFPHSHRMRRELLHFKPDLIHLATPFNVGLTGLHYAKKYGIPHIASYHTHFDRYLQSYGMSFAVPVYWRFMRWFHRTCSAVFAPSKETAAQLEAQGIRPAEIWTRGVDCRFFHPSKRTTEIRIQYGINARYLLLYAGRLSPEKELNVLQEVTKRLPGVLREQIHWLIVGDGPLLNRMQQEMPWNVTFTGWMRGESLAKIYAASDLFVFPSSTETFGNVVLEAAASGLPAVVADRGGVAEIVRHGRTGLQCRAGDAESFAAAAGSLLQHPERLRRYGAAAREEALRRSWDAAMAALLRRCIEISGVATADRTSPLMAIKP